MAEALCRVSVTCSSWCLFRRLSYSLANPSDCLFTASASDWDSFSAEKEMWLKSQPHIYSHLPTFSICVAIQTHSVMTKSWKTHARDQMCACVYWPSPEVFNSSLSISTSFFNCSLPSVVDLSPFPSVRVWITYSHQHKWLVELFRSGLRSGRSLDIQAFSSKITIKTLFSININEELSLWLFNQLNIAQNNRAYVFFKDQPALVIQPTCIKNGSDWENL